MKRHAIIHLIFLLFTTSAYAKCEAGSKTIFSCITQKGKQIEVCDAGKTIIYSFGNPKAKPEIVIANPRNKVSTYQWQGVGRYIHYSVEITKGNTTYSVFHAVDKHKGNTTDGHPVDKLAEEHGIEAGVNVTINDKLVATVKCTEKSIINNIEGVDLKPTE